MASPVTLAGSLPGDDRNGFIPHAAGFIDNPAPLRMIVALVDVNKITEKIATGEKYPTVQLRHVEVLTGDAEKQAEELMQETYSARTGKMQLAYGPGDEMPTTKFPDEGEES